LPENKTEKRLLNLALRQATEEKPIRFYVGSCPDYSHNGQVYTHEGLGEGVPFLTQVHLEADLPILMKLEEARIPFQGVIMVADVEAVDEVFCERFTDRSEAEFLRRCKESIRNTSELLRGTGLDGKLRSSSFFEEFGRERFLYYQEAYREVLAERYRTNDSFLTRVNGDMYSRMEMYKRMYPFIFNENTSNGERDDFLVGRTLRTMAQYLALGRLVGEKTNECFPMIVVHPTRNKGVFNERNRFLLPDDGPQPQPTIPIFEMKRRVY
jgi:hypothetical protein